MFGGAGSNGNNSHRPKDSGILWYLDENDKTKAVRVRTGITDDQYTEIKSDKVTEGMSIIKSMAQSTTAVSATPMRPPMRMF